MKKVLYVLLIMTLCFKLSAKADDIKIHAIVFCNTDDESIGKSCKSDQERFVNQLGIIETALGCEVDWLNVYTGAECSRPNLEKALSGLRCGANDVVFFYYSGHGVHAKADSKDGWLPQICLKYKSYEQDKFVPVTYVLNQIATKGARLNIIVTDCCNNEANWVSVKGLVASEGRAVRTDNINVENLKKLFCDSRGAVIATSSKRGQVSYGPEDGGCFSMAFWDEIYRIEQGQGAADWNSVLEATKKRTLQFTANKQEPVFKVEVNGVPNPTPPVPVPQPVIIAVGEQELGNAFKQIVNPSYSKSQRWNMVDEIVQRLFDPNAQVIIVGMNLKTNVGAPQTIKKYLEELALSKTVKGINIVRTQKNSTGKYNYIVISEIR